MRFKVTAALQLFGQRPHVSTSDPAGNSIKGRNLWSGFFYCCLPQKKGTVCCDSTKAPFTGFAVNANWIMCHLQSGKLDRGEARKLLVRCGNASRFIKELDSNEAELEKEAIAQAIKQAAQLLEQVQKAPKSYPKVQAFLNQFKKPRHRYRFLVLAGPSKVGKTAFARCLCDEGMETLEINCAGGCRARLKSLPPKSAWPHLVRRD